MEKKIVFKNGKEVMVSNEVAQTIGEKIINNDVDEAHIVFFEKEEPTKVKMIINVSEVVCIF